MADDFEGFRCQAGRFGSREFDDFNRNARFIEEGGTVIARVGSLCSRAPRMRRNRTFSRHWHRGGLCTVNGLAQTHLPIGSGDNPPFALLPEDLALEPVELMFENVDFPGQRADQINHLSRAEGGGFVKAGDTVCGRRIHVAIIPQASPFRGGW